MTLKKSVTAQFAAAIVAVAMTFVLVAPSANAQDVNTMSLDELILLVNQLQGGGTGSGSGSSNMTSDVCPYVFTRNLKMGTQGDDVKKLQMFLNGMPETRVSVVGAGSPGSETMYFGPATAAAVKNFQMKYRSDILTPIGLVNPTTYFGNSTRAKANMLCSSSMSDTGMGTGMGMGMGDDDDTPMYTSNQRLGRNEGEIDNLNSISPEESDLEEGQLGEIFAWDFEVEGDIEVNRVDVYLDNTNIASSSDNADDYFTEAQLMVDGKLVDTMEVDDWDEENYDAVHEAVGDEYRIRFSGLRLVFADGHEPEFTIALQANKNIDDDDREFSDWRVQLAVDSVRYADGVGFTDTIGGDTGAGGIEETFGFDEEETADLDITKSSDSPDSDTLEVHKEDTDSEEYEVLILEFEEESDDVDLTIDDMTFQVTAMDGVTGLAENEVVRDVFLYNGSKKLDKERPDSDGVVEFEDLDFDIAAGDTEELTVVLVFKAMDDINAEGASVEVQLMSIDDGEDENGNDENDFYNNEQPVSDTFYLRSQGVVASEDNYLAESKPTDDGTNGNDRAEVTMNIELTAFGEDVYVPTSANQASTIDGNTAGVVFQVEDDSGVVAVDDAKINATFVLESGSGKEESNTVKIGQDASTVMSLFISFDPAATGQYRVVILGVGWADSDVATADETTATLPQSDFRTGYVNVND